MAIQSMPNYAGTLCFRPSADGLQLEPVVNNATTETCPHERLMLNCSSEIWPPGKVFVKGTTRVWRCSFSFVSKLYLDVWHLYLLYQKNAGPFGGQFQTLFVIIFFSGRNKKIVPNWPNRPLKIINRNYFLIIVHDLHRRINHRKPICPSIDSTGYNSPGNLSCDIFALLSGSVYFLLFFIFCCLSPSSATQS
jgi:hypothetical protein